MIRCRARAHERAQAMVGPRSRTASDARGTRARGPACALAPLLALLFAVPLAGAGASAQETHWCAAGGAAGDGEGAAPAVLEAPLQAWIQRLPGQLESEPLVDASRVVATVLEPGGRRSLVVLDLASGRRIAYQPLVAGAPLLPSAWDDAVAVRAAPDRVDVLRVSAARFLTVRSVRAKASVCPPLLVKGVLFQGADDAVEALPLDRNQPAWSVRRGGTMRGRPVLRDGVLFALWYDAQGNATLTALDAARGTVLAETRCGGHGGAVPEPLEPLELAALEDTVFVHFPLPVPGPGGKEFSTARIAWKRTDAGVTFPEAGSARLHTFDAPACATGNGWVARESDADGPARWVALAVLARGEDPRGIVLADRDLHSELLAGPARTASSGGVAWVGADAVDATSFEVLWRLPETPALRPVPCAPGGEEGAWLVATALDTLALYAEPERPRSAAEEEAQARLRAAEQREALALAELAQRALRTRDAGLVARLLRDAQALGASGRVVAAVEGGLERLRQATNGPPPDPRAVLAIQAEEARDRARVADDLARDAEGARDPARKRALLRALLARDPDHPGAVEAARSMLPDDAPLGAHFDPASWLAFLDATDGHPVSFQRPSDPPGPDVVSRRLAREVAGWRPDLVAYRSERLAVITPPGSPGPVARALATGELVCDVLEGLFGADGASVARDPLILLLYQDEAEYRAQSERDHSAPEVARGWTAGHYDPAENVSRMFVPADDRDSRRLLGVYAHELAHHWLATRSPFADRARTVRGGTDRAGFWVVEGIAQWTGELALDPDAGTWSDDDPRAASLDGVVNARPADRVPWGRLLTLDKRGFDGLSIANDRSVPLTWQLGVRLKQSELALFYDQAGALAHWLYGADHGTHRQALVDAVRGWYLGNAAPTDVASVVGLDPDRLGERVVAFASEAVR